MKYDKLISDPSTFFVRMRTQLQYYFSTVNLCTDWFLQQKMREEKNKWIPTKLILSFGKIRKIFHDHALRNITTNIKIKLIQHAIKTSTVVRAHGQMLKVGKHAFKMSYLKRYFYVEGRCISQPLKFIQGISVKNGDGWSIVHVQDKKNIQEIKNQLRKIGRVIEAKEFQNMKKMYQEVKKQINFLRIQKSKIEIPMQIQNS